MLLTYSSETISAAYPAAPQAFASELLLICAGRYVNIAKLVHVRHVYLESVTNVVFFWSLCIFSTCIFLL